jgi:hypothetical protein
MKTTVITMDEWLNAQVAAEARPPGSFTSRDLMDKGLKRTTARERIDKGLRTGVLKHVATSSTGLKYYIVVKGKKP